MTLIQEAIAFLDSERWPSGNHVWTNFAANATIRQLGLDFTAWHLRGGQIVGFRVIELPVTPNDQIGLEISCFIGGLQPGWAINDRADQLILLLTKNGKRDKALMLSPIAVIRMLPVWNRHYVIRNCRFEGAESATMYLPLKEVAKIGKVLYLPTPKKQEVA